MTSSPRSPIDPVRLNKFIAQSGVASRRKADLLIEAGQVSVNGRVVKELGTQIDPIKDRVAVEGLTIRRPNIKSYIAFYKPRGILSTMSGPGETLEPFLAEMRDPGLFHVGRLDKDSEGLLLITNDGEWANRVTHPRYQTSKEYELELDRAISTVEVERLLQGVELDDGLFKADTLEEVGPKKLRVTIHDGRNRVLRRVFAQLGYEVNLLKRLRIGEVRLGRMKPGQWKAIDPQSINQ
jgi:23S rRNA pseudouridine2605 synthase